MLSVCVIAVYILVVYVKYRMTWLVPVCVCVIIVDVYRLDLRELRYIVVVY